MPITTTTRMGMLHVPPRSIFVTEFRLLCRGALPIALAFLSLIFVVVNALVFDNHSKLVEGSCSTCTSFPLADCLLFRKLVTDGQLPQLTSLLPSTRTSFHVPKGKKKQPTPIDTVLSNPFSLSPIVFSIALVFPPFFLPEYVNDVFRELFGCEADSLTDSHQIRSFDLFLAAVQTLVTFSVAYPASVALGSVLLQTSPARGLTSGRMEAFLRVMKEVRSQWFYRRSFRAFTEIRQSLNYRSRNTLKCSTCPHLISGN